MRTEQLAFVQGWADTREALGRWNARPSVVLRPWALASLLVAVLLLGATWVVAVYSIPDPSGAGFPGVNRPAALGDYGFVLFRNGLVLALHALACVAGFMAGSSLPQVAEGYSGVWRRIHELAGPPAIAFVAAATLFSLATQAYALGGGASTLAAQLGVSPLVLILGILPHALPELFALFLPLAAWTIASRARRWHELLAATFVTTAIAVPILLLAGAIEVWVSPRLLLALAA
ncbi:MAG: stage II sporulation protein M [Solirubrobacteraceae bacterium]